MKIQLEFLIFLGRIGILCGVLGVYGFSISVFNHWQFWVILVSLCLSITAQNYIDKLLHEEY